MNIKNSKSKVTRTVTKEEWETIQKNPLVAENWFELPSAKVPPEVQELEQKKETAKAETPIKAAK